MKIESRFIRLALAAVLALTLYACEEQGPAERAGEEIDEAAEEAGEAMEEAGEAVKDEMEKREPEAEPEPGH